MGQLIGQATSSTTSPSQNIHRIDFTESDDEDMELDDQPLFRSFENRPHDGPAANTRQRTRENSRRVQFMPLRLGIHHHGPGPIGFDA